MNVPTKELPPRNLAYAGPALAASPGGLRYVRSKTAFRFASFAISVNLLALIPLVHGMFFRPSPVFLSLFLVPGTVLSYAGCIFGILAFKPSDTHHQEITHHRALLAILLGSLMSLLDTLACIAIVQWIFHP